MVMGTPPGPPAPDHPRILLLGAGALGCGAAMGLAAAGPPHPTLRVADGDRVELSNLQRQVLYRMPDLGQPKVRGVGHRLPEWGAHTRVEPLERRLESPDQIVAALSGCRVMLDGSDNFATRFAANDAALATGLPLVHGAATGQRGQVMTILPGRSACLRCLFQGPPEEAGPTCRQAGVVGPGAGLVGWLMALEAVKLLTGIGTPLTDGVLTLDFATGRQRLVPLPRQRGCPGCGQTRR